ERALVFPSVRIGAHEIVREHRLSMIDPQRIAAEATAVSNDNTVRTPSRNRHVSLDAVVVVEDVWCIRLVECNDARMVGASRTTPDQTWARVKYRRHVAEWESVVLLTFGYEQILKFLQLVGVLVLNVAVFGPVIVCRDVVEMPFLGFPDVLDRLVGEQ